MLILPSCLSFSWVGAPGAPSPKLVWQQHGGEEGGVMVGFHRGWPSAPSFSPLAGDPDLTPC